MRASVLKYKRRALDFLETLPSEQQQRIVARADALLLNSRPRGSKLLVGTGGGERLFRIRVGDYRVEYVLRDDALWILDIGHRTGFYRGL